MTVVRVLAVVAAAVMAGAIIFGFASGDFSEEGSEIVGLAWGKVTLIDLYVGLALFAAWIFIRDGLRPVTVAWWVALAVLGNLAAAAYLVAAAFRSRDIPEVLLGRESRLIR